jgi:hypothetical protein
MKDIERPSIKLNNNAETSEMELFQNHTLRPILKHQNSMILNLFKAQVESQKIVIAKIQEMNVLHFIETTIKRDNTFKSLLIGITIGLFDENELRFYLNHKSEINKRLVNMLIERVRSQWVNFK